MVDDGGPPIARPPRRGLPAWLEALAGRDRSDPARPRQPRAPRPPRSPAPRRRRWLRFLLILVALLVLLYAALPYIVLAGAQRWLPLDLGGGAVVEDVRTYPLADPVNVAVFVRPGRARHLIEQVAPRVWLPPWLLRRGQSADGLAATTTRIGVMKLSWRLVISGGEPRPTVAVRLTTAQAAALLAPYTDIDLGGASVACAIERARLTLEDRVDGAAPEWLLRLEASGRLRFSLAGGESDVPVSKLIAHLRVTFKPDPRGWRPAATLVIDSIETDATDAPMISAPATRRQLEGVVNTELKHRLAGEVLPPWFPTDAVIEGEISPEALKP